MAKPEKQRHHKNSLASARKKVWQNFSLSALLLAGTALSGVSYSVYQMEHRVFDKFPNTTIVIGKDTIPHDEFYANIEKQNNKWVYLKKTSEKTDTIDLNDLSDYLVLGNSYFNSFLNRRFSQRFDSVEVKKNIDTNRYMYSRGTLDSLQNMPSYGLLSGTQSIIRHFYSKDENIDAKIQKNNDDFNATSDHENQHFNNLIVKNIGQSYETKFSELCMDEISANIRQLLRQRQNYIEHDYDPAYITDRFRFYRDWVKLQPEPLKPIKCKKPEEDIGKKYKDVAEEKAEQLLRAPFFGKPYSQQSPSFWKLPNVSADEETLETLSADEAKFIATGVLKAWIEDKFPIYKKKLANMTTFILKKADYNGCQDNPSLHFATMREIFYINGIDFYQYIAGQEYYFKENIPEDYQKKFAALTKQKKLKMSYMEKVGEVTHNNPAEKDKYFHGLKQKYLWDKFKRETPIGKIIR